jgi:hypothetical protein
MAQGKNSFILYTDLVHTVEKLSDQKAGELFKHILRYVNDKYPVNDDILIQIAFEPIRQQLKRDLKDWENKLGQRSEAGKRGGIISGLSRRSKQNEANEANASKSKQNEANEAVTVTDTVNVTDTVIDISSKEGEISVDECLTIAMKDEKWMRLNKTNKEELTAFNYYLERLGYGYKVPIDYKAHFSRLKVKNPSILVKHYTIEELKELAKQMDNK